MTPDATSSNSKIPASVPEHLIQSNPKLWTIPDQPINWKGLDLLNSYTISGSAFIDPAEPLGPKGNTFTIIVGSKVNDLDFYAKQNIASRTGTPETIFINEGKKIENTNIYDINVTVLTPSGKELGACAHGFIGGMRTLTEVRVINLNSEVNIQPTDGPLAKAYISEAGIVSLEFQALDPSAIVVDSSELIQIFGFEVLTGQRNLPVLSVGSPKLMIELSNDAFAQVQSSLSKLNFGRLEFFQNRYKINGIHIYTRDIQTKLPAKSIQINAYLGENNMVDKATGVSNASQVSADTNIKVGDTVHITQFDQKGPSAVLVVTKLENNKVQVGGDAVLFNYEEIKI